MYLAQELGIEIDADELAGCYISSISSSKEPMEQETLEYLAQLIKKNLWIKLIL